MNIYLMGFAAVFLVSLISFVGVASMPVALPNMKKILFLLVSLSAGTMLGDAFLHLIPESIEQNPENLELVAMLILTGILAFFVLEKIICWRHCHIPTSEEHPHQLAIMNLVGDVLHNFIDGAIIAGSFLAGPKIGIGTTLAIISHEIPQEIGDYGVLIHAGYSRKKALFLNFLIALTAFVGLLLVFALNAKLAWLETILPPFTAGGFIYIATADLIPEMKKEPGFKKSFLQLLAILIGIFLMSAVR